MIGWVTLDVGEQAIIYSLQGHARIEEGPKRMFLWREKFKVLTRYSANQNEYVVIRSHDGCVTHTQGPFVIFSNPIRHASIHVEAMLSLDASEALVVYSQETETGNVKRYIKYGPCQFMPAANEWLHEFSWHGTDPGNKTKVIKDQNTFKKIKIIPDQFYYNVDEVRTADDALIRVKLMMFFELVDIEKMLNATHDPVADFVNCLCADVVSFASKRTYMGFIEQSSELNDINQYTHLLERCKAIGFVVSKVVFRGYYAHDQLQKLHDTAIDKRNRLKIKYEQEEQTQNLTDLKIQNELQRMKQEQEMELEKLEHRNKMEKSKLTHDLDLKKREADEELKKKMSEKEAILNAQKAQQTQELEHLKKLSKLDVSLTKYLVSEKPRPGSVTRIFAKSPTLHLHHSGTAPLTGTRFSCTPPSMTAVPLNGTAL